MNNRANLRTQLTGQAGVWAVAAQLAVRGHVPLFPGVDYGYDIMLDNGIRLQVKSAHLSQNIGNVRKRYPGGVYHFNTTVAKIGEDGQQRRVVRDYSTVADFFVLWGIDEDRFWVVPTGQPKNSFFMCSRSPLNDFPQYMNIKERNSGWENNWGVLDVALQSKQLIESSVKETI
jgi:hypothetical protein